MAEGKVVVRQFSGGLATTSEKKDVSYAAKRIINLNPFEDPSYITLARKATKVSGSTVTSYPVTSAEDGSPYDTNRYFLNLVNTLYKEDSGGSWSQVVDYTASLGQLKVFDDYLYIAGGTKLNRYGKLSLTPANEGNFLANGVFNLDTSGGGTGSADYVPPVNISESATNRQTFTVGHDPIEDIVIDVDTVGTGDWTLTVHDTSNNEIGSHTHANADMATGDNTFAFSTALRVVIGNEYHFHVTSTVADGGVDTNAATDLEGAEFSVHFGILISNSNFHPMVVVEDTLIIGNERYLATWDQATYEPNMVTLDPGFQVRAIAKFDDYIVIAANKGTSIQSSEESRLYYWDGITTGSIVSYNYFKDVTFGPINTIHNSKGNLIGVFGNGGAVYVGTDPFTDIIDRIPRLARGKFLEVYPSAITEHEGRTLIGVSAYTDDATSLEQGVYEFGRQQSYLPEVFNFPYTISTGTTQGTTLKITMVKSFGTDLYIGWQDDTAYGVDKISLGDDACASGSWESLIFDGDNPTKEKLPFTLKIEFEPLTTGQSVTPKYKLDRASSWTTGTAASTVGDTSIELPIYTRCNEIEFGFDLASTSNTFIKIIGIVLEYDDLAEEE